MFLDKQNKNKKIVHFRCEFCNKRLRHAYNLNLVRILSYKLRNNSSFQSPNRFFEKDTKYIPLPWLQHINSGRQLILIDLQTNPISHSLKHGVFLLGLKTGFLFTKNNLFGQLIYVSP